VFGTRYELLEWVRKVTFRLGFVVVILRSDQTKQLEQKVERPMSCWDVKEVENI